LGIGLKYCFDNLRLSNDAAYNRVAAARAVRRFPVILDQLADGSVNVTTVKLLRPVLTRENHLAVLAEARHRSNREVKVIVARLAPQPDVPSSIRKLPAPRTIVPCPVVAPPGEEDGSVAPPPVFVPPPDRRPVIAPLTLERYRLQFTVSKENGSRDIPAHVRRAVWRRDDGRCAFEGRSGRCSERTFLEWHHVRPHGHHGPATVENISLRCRAHNVYESELVFGRFDPSVVRETPENYAVSGEITPVAEREPVRSQDWRSTSV
jgi:hypothetical protein